MEYHSECCLSCRKLLFTIYSTKDAKNTISIMTNTKLNKQGKRGVILSSNGPTHWYTIQQAQLLDISLFKKQASCQHGLEGEAIVQMLLDIWGLSMKPILEWKYSMYYSSENIWEDSFSMCSSGRRGIFMNMHFIMGYRLS